MKVTSVRTSPKDLNLKILSSILLILIKSKLTSSVRVFLWFDPKMSPETLHVIWEKLNQASGVKVCFRGRALLSKLCGDINSLQLNWGHFSKDSSTESIKDMGFNAESAAVLVVSFLIRTAVGSGTFTDSHFAKALAKLSWFPISSYVVYLRIFSLA